MAKSKAKKVKNKALGVRRPKLPKKKGEKK